MSVTSIKIDDSMVRLIDEIKRREAKRSRNLVILTAVEYLFDWRHMRGRTPQEMRKKESKNESV